MRAPVKYYNFWGYLGDGCDSFDLRHPFGTVDQAKKAVEGSVGAWVVIHKCADNILQPVHKWDGKTWRELETVDATQNL